MQDYALLLLKIFLDLEMTQFWSVDYICEVCKLKLLFWTCPNVCAIFVFIGSYLQFLLNIFYHRSTVIVFGIDLFDTFWRSWKLLFFEVNIFKVFLYLCFFTQDPVTSVSQE